MDRRGEFERALAALTVRSVLLGMVVRNLRVAYSPELEEAVAVAGATLYLGPEFFSMSGLEKVAALAHGGLHVVLKHGLRGRGRDRRLWNLAADCAANYILEVHGFKLPPGAPTPALLAKLLGKPRELVESMTADGIYRLLVRCEKSGDHGWLTLSASAGEDLMEEGPKEVEVLQEGSVTQRSEEELERLLRKCLVYAKIAGSLPVGAEIAIERALEARVDWRAVLREAVKEGIRRAYRTWLKPSRRGEGLPAYKIESGSDVYCLVDTCLVAGMEVLMADGSRKPIEDICIGDRVLALRDGKFVEAAVVAKWQINGEQEIYRVSVEGGIDILCTGGHRFLTTRGWKRARSLKPMDLVYVVVESDAETVDERRNRIPKRVLREDPCERDSREIRPYSRSSKSKGESPRSLRVESAPLDERGDRNAETTVQEGEVERASQDAPPLGTRSSDEVVRAESDLYDKGQDRRAEEVSKGESRVAEEDVLPALRRRIRDFADTRGDPSLPEVEETTVRIGNGLHTEDATAASGEVVLLHRRGSRDAIRGREVELRPRRVLAVEKAGRTERVFDITTTAGCYFVNGVVCHNSGSVEQEELEQFAGEVLSIAKSAGCRVWIVPWDAEPHGIFRADRVEEVLEIFERHLKGGGGTVLEPALELCLDHMRKRGRRAGAVVVLSDGYWSDSPADSLRKVAARTKLILVTTAAVPDCLPSTATAVKVW